MLVSPARPGPALARKPTMPTERLYLRDSFLSRFEARVLGASKQGERPAIVLDRSAFYPEGGGQLPDRGQLVWPGATCQIVDVQVDDDGVVHHVVEGALPPEGAVVEGSIDMARRRDFMSQHTGQHMLSKVLLDVARAETVSSRLGAETSTIDVSVPELSDAACAEVEDVVNDRVLDDTPIVVLFPTAAELSAMPLRRGPKVETGVRVVHVVGLDHSPCGGTHCARTGQVGPVRIVSTERYKGMTRVTFVAGRRAIVDARANARALREVARGFTCGVADVPAQVAKLRAELKARHDDFGNVRGELLGLLAERELSSRPEDASGTTFVVVSRPGDDIGGLRVLASKLASRGDVVAACAGAEQEGFVPLVVERGAKASFDAGKWFKAKVAAAGGKGGGRPEKAEGRVPVGVSIEALLRG